MVQGQECSFSPPARLPTGDTHSHVDGWLTRPVWERRPEISNGLQMCPSQA